MLKQVMRIDVYHDRDHNYACDTCAVLVNNYFPEQIVLINFRTEKVMFYNYDDFIEFINDEEFIEICIIFYDNENKWKNIIKNILLCNDEKMSDALKGALEK